MTAAWKKNKKINKMQEGHNTHQLQLADQRPGLQHRVLRSPHTGGGDETHGLRDSARVLDRFNATLEAVRFACCTTGRKGTREKRLVLGK
jgi:hypothetical protein